MKERTKELQVAKLRFAGNGFNVIWRQYRSRRPYTQAADLDEADRAHRRIYRSTSTKSRSKMCLASGFVGNVISTFSRSRNLYLTPFDNKLRKDEAFWKVRSLGVTLSPWCIGGSEAGVGFANFGGILLCNRLQGNLRSCHDEVVTQSSD